MAKAARLSDAQVRFMKEHAPAYFAWLKATGSAVGIKIQPWQKRVIEALIRKDCLTPDGHITEVGKQAFEKKLAGKKASLVIIDDVHETTV